MLLPLNNNAVLNNTQNATALLGYSLATLADRTERCENLNHCRTIWDIVWSCLVMISLCIWVGIHPNMPQLNPPRTCIISVSASSHLFWL